MMSASAPVSANVKRFFIVAGEPSGDLHAARLMRALRERCATDGVECTFEGIGGEQMTAQGLQSLVPLADISVVGFWEVAKRYRFFTKLLAQCANILRSGNFTAFLPVDYPGFNLRLAESLRSVNIRSVPVYWYIAPQLWAWGAKRAARLRGAVDKLIVVFPFEEEFFRSRGIETHFVGHPLMDDAIFTTTPNPLADRTNTIALLPGSRAQEVERNLPLFLDAALEASSFLAPSPTQRQIEHKKVDKPDYTFTVAAAPHLASTLYRIAERSKYSSLRITLTNDARSLMQTARAGIVKTGTSTLEAALLGMPFLMAYRTSPLTYQIAKRKVTLPRIALANIVAGREAVREFIQHEATPTALGQELCRLLANDNTAADQMQQDFAGIRSTLGSAGASELAAELIAAWSA
jgi:lipid-A-disaccharide synthase